MPALLAMSLGICDLRAQEKSCAEPRQVDSAALDEPTWNRLNAIYGDIAENRLAEAYEKLQKLLDRSGRDPYLQAVIYQALAHVEWSREHGDSSLEFLEQALALDSLPDQAHFALLFQLSQTYFTQGRFEEALESLESWFCVVPDEDITATPWVLQAYIYVELGDFGGALKAIENAISLGSEAVESWYQLKLAAQYELEQYPQAAATLEAMIAKWPGEKTYWTQLSQIYYRLKFPDRSLAVQSLAYRNGLLDKQVDIVYLSNLYREMEIPYQAAIVLETAIRQGIVEANRFHWTNVAEAWYAANEMDRSLAAFAEAGSASSDGAIDLRRGYILVDQERWPAALESLNLALEKGGLDEHNTAEAYLLRGMARFNLGHLDSAGMDWEKARRFDQTRDSASQWLNFLREELKRSAS